MRRSSSHRLLPIVIALLAGAFSCLGWGCGAGDTPVSDVTLTVASKNTAEEIVLGEIYAQALEAAGYKVKRELNLPIGLPPFDRKEIHISGYPEHLNIALGDITLYKHGAPGNPMKAYELAKERLEERGLTAFPPTPFSRSKAVGMLRRTAEERGLKSLSDLKPQADEISLATQNSCQRFADCLAGLERLYGITFGSISETEPAQRYEVLKDGEAETAILLSTEGQLAGKKSRFVILEDDKHRLPAGNVIWVTTPDVVDEAGPEYEKAILDAQRGLTLKVVQELDKKVMLEGRQPSKVAAEYLRHFSN